MTTVDQIQSRRRVLFVIGTMGGGGAERQVLEILKRLDRSRFEPMLYLAMKQGELLGSVPSDVQIFAFWDGSPEPQLRKLLRWLKLTRIVRYAHLAHVLRLQKIDVIYDRTYLATLDAAGACIFRPTPRISCCVVDPQPELELHSRWSTSMSWWFARRAYQSASIVLANSMGLRQRLIDYFCLNPNHVQVVHNLLTASSSSTQGGQPSIPAEMSSGDAGTSTTAFKLLTAGRLHPQKGHRYLLEAVDELVHQKGCKIHLSILGQGKLESELREFVRSHQLEPCVTFAGFIDDPAAWYRNADLFVLPSLYEGMPNALIDAVMAGTPVLSTDCPSGPYEILDGGRCGRLVPPGDSKTLADAIADAMDRPEEWRRHARAARARAQDLFDPVRNMQLLETLLEQVANKSRVRLAQS